MLKIPNICHASAIWLSCCFAPALTLADDHIDNETVVVVSTRLAMVGEMAPISLTVTKEYKDGEDEVRRFDPREVPRGTSIVSWVESVTAQMENAGFVRRPAVDDEGIEILEFVRSAKVIARFSTTITITGSTTVTRDLDVALDLEKPGWPSVRDKTTAWFDPSVERARQGQLRADYKRWVSTKIDRIIADNERSVVVLDDAKKEQLRQPSRSTVSQSRPVSVAGSDNGTITVSVTSQVINRRLGVN